MRKFSLVSGAHLCSTYLHIRESYTPFSFYLTASTSKKGIKPVFTDQKPFLSCEQCQKHRTVVGYSDVFN